MLDQTAWRQRYSVLAILKNIDLSVYRDWAKMGDLTDLFCFKICPQVFVHAFLMCLSLSKHCWAASAFSQAKIHMWLLHYRQFPTGF